MTKGPFDKYVPNNVLSPRRSPEIMDVSAILVAEKPESSRRRNDWIPACAGMTKNRYEFIERPANRAGLDQKGLTLIELMVSFFFLSLIVISSVYVLMTAHYMSEESRGRLLALNAARSTLEAVKQTPLTAVPAINTVPFIPAELRNGAIAIATNPVNLTGVQIATVTVTVTWNGPRNRPFSLQVTTMRSRF